MKKFIICLMMLCSFGAYATGENERVTSMGYVTEELDTRQDKFDKLGADTAMTYSGTTDGVVTPRAITGDLGNESNTTNTAIPTVGAVDTKLENKQDELDFAANTVLMNTGVAGEPMAKGIYQTSGDYNTQVDSLVDAATFNAALQNAINSELSCAQRKDPNDPTSKCLLFNIFAPTQNLMIPNTYTRLEYLESTGTQYINTHQLIHKNDNARADIDMQVVENGGWLGADAYLQLNISSYYRLATGALPRAQQIPMGNRDKITLTYTDGREKLYVNNQFIHSIKWSQYSQPYNTFMIFGLGFNTDTSYGTCKLKIYDLKLNINNSLVGHYIPARRNSDNVLGMYDTVSGTFFTNAGTGTFIAGPEMSSNIYLPMN